MTYILTLDQGTTSSRAIILDKDANILSFERQEFPQYYPQPGWVEHDPEEIWQSQLAVAGMTIERAGIGAEEIAAIGIANQRETTVVWSRKTGKPIYNAIVWQDRRTAAICEKLIDKERLIREKTGLLLDSYFSGPKIQWILDNVDGARSMAERGELAAGTIDSWLVWKLTEGRLHITDPTNACRSLLFDIRNVAWDDELLDLFHIPKSLLPEVRPSSEAYGETAAGIFPAKISIASIIGDQQSALFGQRCVKRGMAKCTYGTGCFMLLNTGGEAVASEHRLLTTIAWKIGREVVYALEGSVFVGGAVVQWLRDGLKLIRRSEEVEALASSVVDNGGVYFVPAFVGLGAPHWDPYASGLVIGLTRGTTGGHLARAALEGIAYQVADLLEAMRADSGARIEEMRVDGAAASNNLLMQFQADILKTKIMRPENVENTALGAAFMAGLAVGLWKDKEALDTLWTSGRTFAPEMESDAADRLKTGWQRALERSRGWKK